tara:strand:+ start:883 stop:2439 length:1557 start_codon:yes stop_codon:yes gene_type:complete
MSQNKFLDNSGKNLIEALNKNYEKFDQFSTNLQTISVPFIEFERIYRGYNNLKKQIGENINNPFWTFNLKIISKYRFACSSTVLPPNHKNLINDEELNILKKNVIKCENIFFDCYNLFKGLVENIVDISSKNLSPYIIEIKKLQEKYGNLTIVYTSNDFIENSKEYLLENNFVKFQIINQKDYLYSYNDIRNVILIGHYSWFNSNIFALPKSGNLYSCNFDFHGGKSINIPNFLSPLWDRNISAVTITKTEIKLNNVEDDPLEELVDITFNSELQIQTGNTQNLNEEKLNCLKTLLAGNKICFLCCEEGIDESQDGLFFYENGEPYIKKMKVKNFESGDYVCLRLGSDNDLTHEVADQMMKNDEKTYLRDYQNKWKNLIIKFLKNHPKTVLENRIDRAGIPSNINYWISEKCIKTKEYDTFEKLLNIVDEEDDKINIQETWDALRLILRYHIQAGAKIKFNLKKSISNDDLSMLNNQGYQVFKVEGTDASIGVFRIEKIAKETTKQFKSYLDKIIELN